MRSKNGSNVKHICLSKNEKRWQTKQEKIIKAQNEARSHALNHSSPFAPSFSPSNAWVNLIQLILTWLKLIKGGMGWGLSGPLLRFLISCNKFNVPGSFGMSLS